MFWVLLLGMYAVTFPVNYLLLRHVWYRRYRPDFYRLLADRASASRLMKAQVLAVGLFGVVQPLLAVVPLVYGHEWYHYLIAAGAAIAYSASGSSGFFVDRVRSSHLMFAAVLVVFLCGVLALRLALPNE